MLPGNMYRKNKRWWWKVKLPGEDRTRARALKAAGAQFAATSRKVAEQVAREMWELAIEAQTEARFKAKAKEKNKCHAEAMAKVKAEAAEAVAKAQAKAKKKKNPQPRR